MSKRIRKTAILTLLRSGALEEASEVPLYNSLTVYDTATKYISNNLLITFNGYRMLNRRDNFNSII